jgi:predicted nuclease of predicted toxin-antitoxin system
MRFLVDAQLPPALARWLTERGHEASHVVDHQLAAAKDIEIWRFATALGAIVVTKDEDFVYLHRGRSTGPAVVWVRVGNTTRR